MAIPAAAIAKAAIGVLSNEKTRKTAGWVLVAILSPIILLIAAFCSILGGSADHNSSILDLCFYGGTLCTSESWHLPKDRTVSCAAGIGWLVSVK